MSVDDNRSTIRAVLEAWQTATHAITEVFADDMVWRIEGHSFASREHANKQQFVDEVLAPFGARFVDGDAFRPVNIRSVLADGDTVAVVWDGRGVANDDKALRKQLRLDHAHAQRQGCRRHRLLRQHLFRRRMKVKSACWAGPPGGIVRVGASD